MKRERESERARERRSYLSVENSRQQPLHSGRCKTSSIGQSAELLIHRSSVRFRQKLKKSRTQIYMDFELHRPSSKGSKLLLQVIKAIINQPCSLVRRESFFLSLANFSLPRSLFSSLSLSLPPSLFHSPVVSLNVHYGSLSV